MVIYHYTCINKAIPCDHVLIPTNEYKIKHYDNTVCIGKHLLVITSKYQQINVHLSTIC